MIYIEKGSEFPLPEKYHIAHNFCVQVHDMILEILEHERFKELFKTEVSFENSGEVSVPQLEDSDILEWLASNGKLEAMENILIKRLLTSITGDLLSFLQEGLNCSMRGVTNVAYANFRKPLKDSLTLLEMILIDPTDFAKTYYLDGDPNNYDPSCRKLNKEELISKALDRLGNPKLLSKELIYKLRFDKSNPNGFDSLSNLALHIVTRDKNYKTENRNLNFIFASKDDINNHWDHIYFFLPYLIHYILYIIDEIVFSVIDLGDDIKSFRKNKLNLKLIYWALTSEKFELPENLIQNFWKDETCSECKASLDLGIHDLELFFESDLLLCKSCFSSVIDYPSGFEPDFDDVEFSEENFEEGGGVGNGDED